MRCSSRASACRRESNSHDAAKPREPAGTHRRAAARSSQGWAREASNYLLAAMYAVGQPGRLQGSNYLEPLPHIEPAHCVGSSGFQSVRPAALATSVASGFGQVRRLKKHVPPSSPVHNSRRSVQSTTKTRPWQAHRWHACGSALPNPSLKGSANGMPPGPASRYGVHFLPAGPGVMPLAPP